MIEAVEVFGMPWAPAAGHCWALNVSALFREAVSSRQKLTRNVSSLQDDSLPTLGSCAIAWRWLSDSEEALVFVQASAYPEPQASTYSMYFFVNFSLSQ